MVILVSLATILQACTWDDVTDQAHGYPSHIEPILRASCATPGCHTAASAAAAAGLNLETWEDLFKGSRGGSPVIPYSPEQSYLLFAVNTDSTVGPTLAPTMPIGQPTLNLYDYEALVHWIAAGARNAKGEERYPPIPGRKKWYVANRGCDLVAVLDAESRQIMRYVPVGTDLDTGEEPYSIHVSPDQAHWYVIFAANHSKMEKYSTLTDEKVAEIDLSHRIWNSLALSPDGKFAFLVSGVFKDVAAVNLEEGRLAQAPIYMSKQVYGIAVHPTHPHVYVSIADESSLVLLDYAADGSLSHYRELDLIQGHPPASGGEVGPYDIMFAPDHTTYFVTCWLSHEVRVFDAGTDSLLEVIAVGTFPSKMAISPANGRLYVACMEETAMHGGDASKRGAVAVIDYATRQLETMVYAGYQPRGLAVDEATGHLIIANRNYHQDGPAQHHASLCEGRNGNLTLLDLATLQPVPGFKAELSVDPYAIAVKK